MTEHAAALPRAVRSRGGPDRVTVMLVTLAAFLAVFASLAGRLRATAASSPASPRVVVLRRVYETTIVNDGRRGGAGGATTVSVATSGSAPSPAPTTRSSSHP